ncbi:4a-hydroxytetrahydrobiopterin dehydratase [Alphaproteobacteria bacterium LSUCC0684]
MSDYTEQHCEACRADAPLASPEATEAFLQRHPNWALQEQDGIPKLVQTYTFPNFVEALAFANQIGEISEAEGHHPALLVEWGRVRVEWWSHKINGLHENDFIMAAKCDALGGA